MAAETDKAYDLVVDLQVACQAEELPTEEQIGLWLTSALQLGAESGSRRYEVGVRVVDEQESQTLNAEYRGKDTPTNVLAFPVGSDLTDLTPSQEACPLGDLVVCAPVVMREAAEQGKAPAAHWAHILVHGMLHLLGYDHERAEQALEMEGLEARVLAARGFADPYRSDGRT